MSTADKLNKLLETKQAIRQAIIDKGIEVADDTKFADYPSKISSIPMEGGDPYYEDLYNMRTNNGTNMTGLFARTSGELDLRNLDVSNVTSMEYMFDNSSASVNIDGWDTSNVTDMSYMFNYFTGSIDISKLDNSSLTNASNMFYNANTDNIILTGLSFPKCTKLDYMFYNASGTILDLSSWDISNITSMGNMLAGSYKKIDLTGWKTTNVTNMSGMFYKYNNPLEELIIPDWDMTSYSGNIFYNSSYMTNLKLIDLSRSNDATITKIASHLPTRTATTFGTVLVPENTSQEAYDALVAKYWRPIGAALSPVPTSCSIVAELDEIMPGKSTKVYVGACEPWNTDPSNVELVVIDNSIATITEDNEVISTGVLGNIVLEARIKDTQEVVGTKTIVVSETDSYPNLVKFKLASTPSTSISLITVNGSNKKLSDLTYDSITDIYSYNSSVPITKVSFHVGHCISELIKLNTSNVTDMGYMFKNCGSLISLDVSNFDTSNVTIMRGMFEYCSKLTSLDISNFDISNVTDMYGMFADCTSLHILRLDNCSNNTISKIINSGEFPTNAISGVTRTIYCKEENAAGLTPPENWVFSYVPEEEPEVPEVPEEPSIPLYVPGEFQGNWAITEVITMVNESHTDLNQMFLGCTSLVSVNTEDWDTSNVTTMEEVFYHCYKLTSLDLSSFDTSNVTSIWNMFSYCTGLTTLDLSNFDISKVTWTGSIFYNCTSLHTLRLDNCSYDTINKIITSSDYPTNAIEGVTRTIYCKEANAAGLTAPTNWVFSYVD